MGLPTPVSLIEKVPHMPRGLSQVSLGSLKLTISGILGPHGAHLSDLRDLLKEKVESGTRGQGSLTGSAWEKLNHREDLVVLKPRIASQLLGSTQTGIPLQMGGGLISCPHFGAPGILFLNSESPWERICVDLDPY